MNTPTEIRERWAKVASTIDALGTFVDETLARMDGVVVESASEPNVEPEAQPFQCSCVGGDEAHHHVASSPTGTACIRHLLAHQERYGAEYVKAAKAEMGAPVASSPSTPEVAPEPATKATTSDIREAVVAARGASDNLTTTKAKGLKGTVKKALAERFGVAVSTIGWVDYDIRKNGA